MIRAQTVRVIGADGAQAGIMPTSQALNMAKDAGLDLVEVAGDAVPPVCRIMDFGKFKYLQSKKLSESRKKSNIVEIKEVKFRPKTGVHDYQVKLKNIIKFLGDKNKIKISLRFQGREIVHPKIGTDLMHRLINDVSEVAVAEQIPRLEGKLLTMILAPKNVITPPKKPNRPWESESKSAESKSEGPKSVEPKSAESKSVEPKSADPRKKVQSATPEA
jgi:translation initiation factor IF-3